MLHYENQDYCHIEHLKKIKISVLSHGRLNITNKLSGICVSISREVFAYTPRSLPVVAKIELLSIRSKLEQYGYRMQVLTFAISIS